MLRMFNGYENHPMVILMNNSYVKPVTFEYLQGFIHFPSNYNVYSLIDDYLETMPSEAGADFEN
jgi:hypothetical protein